MAAFSIPETTALTHYVELADAEGRLFLVPTATVNALRAAGLTSLNTTIALTADPPERWLTVTEAAVAHMSDIDGLTLAVAKANVSRACREEKLVSRGEGTLRRIEPKSLAAWRLAERERNLARDQDQ